MKIKVFADTICGWCFIGHSRLNKALEKFKDVNFEIEHMPFHLNPDMPKDGIERSKYLEIKFGGKKNAQPMYDRMAEEAKKEGLNFNLDDIKKTPNTALSHLLINLAEKEKKQNKIKEKIYQSYFVEGLDIGNKAILINIGKQFNINENIINKFFMPDFLYFTITCSTRGCTSWETINYCHFSKNSPFFYLSQNLLFSFSSLNNLNYPFSENIRKNCVISFFKDELPFFQD